MWRDASWIPGLFMRVVAPARPSNAASDKAHVCAHCGASALRRSYTRWHERSRKIFGSRPYRCQTCYQRTWLRPFPEQAQTSLETIESQPSWTIDLKDLDRNEQSLDAPKADPFLAYASVDWQIRGLLEALKRLAELDAPRPTGFRADGSPRQERSCCHGTTASKGRSRRPHASRRFGSAAAAAVPG